MAKLLPLTRHRPRILSGTTRKPGYHELQCLSLLFAVRTRPPMLRYTWRIEHRSHSFVCLSMAACLVVKIRQLSPALRSVLIIQKLPPADNTHWTLSTQKYWQGKLTMCHHHQYTGTSKITALFQLLVLFSLCISLAKLKNTTDTLGFIIAGVIGGHFLALHTTHLSQAPCSVCVNAKALKSISTAGNKNQNRCCCNFSFTSVGLLLQ